MIFAVYFEEKSMKGYYRFRMIIALSGCEKGPQVEIGGKWRHPTTVT
jgi:hypothetical protein